MQEGGELQLTASKDNVDYCFERGDTGAAFEWYLKNSRMKAHPH